MALVDCKDPIYDNQVHIILDGLKEGKSRKELAESLKYKHPVSLDNYMRRRNFSWDSKIGTFVPAVERYGEISYDLPPGLAGTRVGSVISAFSQEDADIKSVAAKLGFSSHLELADYMMGKGYLWDRDKRNYSKAQEGSEAKSTEENNVSIANPSFNGDLPTESESNGMLAMMQKYLPLLEILEGNKEKLNILLGLAEEKGQFPRYAINGSFKCKTVHMVDTLDRLVRDFSREKNISQRDIFEISLIEFFKRYGFDREVASLLGE